jgi:galactose mutarotase-like enzyme
MELGNVTGAVSMHGFMSRTDQWKVIEVRADAKAAWVTSRLESFRQPAPARPTGTAPANPRATPNFVCFEPMVAITNALNLAHKGVYRELQSIPPGATWQESFWVRPSGF